MPEPAAIQDPEPTPEPQITPEPEATMSNKVCEPGTFSVIEGKLVEYEVMEWSLVPSDEVDVDVLNSELLIAPCLFPYSAPSLLHHPAQVMY